MTIVQSRRPTSWGRLRYQTAGGIILGCLAPFALRMAAGIPPDGLHALQNALIGAIVAVCVGIWLSRNVATYPGAGASATVLPSYCASFGVLLIVLLLGRFDYNRALLIGSFVLSTGFHLVASHLAQRGQRLVIGVVPVGDTASLFAIDRISCVVLTGPDAPLPTVDAVAADLRADLPDAWERALADYALTGMSVFHTKHLFESLTGRVEIEHISENSFGLLAPERAYLKIKHLVDWVTALVAVVVLLPLLCLIGLVIRLTSPGPAIFVQERIGFHGVRFRMYKFRTMRVDKPAQGDRDGAITIKADPRVTRFGRLLRQTRIDELPQLFNILRGEMSWIGPRPEAVALSAWYQDEISFYRYRHTVRPGIAGWAQVCQGHVADVEAVRSKLHFDFYYIKHFSLWLDLLIVSRTAWTMLTGFGSR